MGKELNTPPPHAMARSSSGFFPRSFDNLAARVLSIEKREKHNDVPENSRYIPINAEHIMLSGRHQFSVCSAKGEKCCRMDWPGVYVMVCVTGTEAVYMHIAGGSNYFNVYVNGLFQRAIGTKYDESSYLVARNLSPDSKYIITLVKRTEAYLRTAITYFKPARLFGFSLYPDTAKIQPCPLPTLPDTDTSQEKPCRYFEFVGDSDTCAFGVEGPMTAANSISMDPSTCNIDRSWARVLSRRFGAISHTLSWSGKAISKNPNFLGKATIVDMYDRDIANEADTQTIHAERPYIATEISASAAESEQTTAADAVFILGGSNDFLLSPRPTEADFISDYERLIGKARSRHKKAYIFCVVLGSTAVAGIDDGDEESKRPLIDLLRRLTHDAVRKMRGLGDDSVFLIDLDDQVDLAKERDFALIMHWNAFGHWKIAAAIEKMVRQITGWDTIEDERRPRQSRTEDIFVKIDIPGICPTTIRQAWTPVRMPAICAGDALDQEPVKSKSRWGSTRRKAPCTCELPSPGNTPAPNVSSTSPEPTVPPEIPASPVPEVYIQRSSPPLQDTNEDASPNNKETE